MRTAWATLLLLSILSLAVLLEPGFLTPQDIPNQGLSQADIKSALVACSPDSAGIQEGQSVVVRAWAYPTAGHTLQYLWTANAGVVQGVNQEVTWDLRKVEAGSYQAKVTVSDSSNSVGSCSVRVDVVEVDRGSHESGREFLVRGIPEASGYGLYSYLLFGSLPSEATRDRYLKALEAYLAFNKISDLQAVNYKPNQLNITYLPLDAPANNDVNAAWLLVHYDFSKARSLLNVLQGERRDGIYFVSSTKPLSKGSLPPYLIQNLTAVPTSPRDLITWWVREFLNQAAQEHFWEPRTTKLLALRLRTTIAVLAAGLPEVKQSLDTWISWTK